MFSSSRHFNGTKRILFFCVVCAFMASIGLFANVHAAKAAEICNAGGTIPMGKYYLNSNEWGASSGTGTQCIWDTSNSSSSIAWGTSWNWSGGPSSVKSYDSSVLGWHWGWQNANTGLPIQLSSNQGVQTGWNFNLKQNTANTLDVSYDLWLHTIPNPTTTTPSDEVMVWLYKSGGAGPVGTKQATVTIDGTSWDLYEGNIGWEVHSFLRTTNTTSQTLDLKDFLNYLASRGLSKSKYLTSVESGTEIFTGNGELDTTSYYANVVTEGITPTPTPTPGSYEAESSANTLGGRAVVVACSTCSGGAKVGNVGKGGTLQFNNVQVSSTGTHTVTISYIDGDAGRTAQMSVNGGAATTVTFHGTNNGNWTTLQSITLPVQLNAGNNTIQFSNASASAPDFDRIMVS